MKICWDNIEDLWLYSDGFLWNFSTKLIEKDACKVCGEPYLTPYFRQGDYCSSDCANKYRDANNFSVTPSYKRYANQISFAERIREKIIDGGSYLEVTCTYCGRWFLPSTNAVKLRAMALRGTADGELRLYCSDGCKRSCSIFGRVSWPKGHKSVTSREVQPELRQMVLERDNWTCQYGACGKTVDDTEIHCHHIEGININPIESADIDMCITLCKEHHKLVHTQEDCRYHQLKCPNGLDK